MINYDQLRLVYFKDRDGEIQCPMSTWGNPHRRKPILAVALMSRNDELTFLTDFHSKASLIPSRDNFSDSGLVCER